MNLYKKDSKGKIRILTITTDGEKLVQTSGLLGGKLVDRVRHCKPKNVGRSNATTATEQAELEKQSKITEKLKEGYFKTEAEAESTEIILPMLAKSMDDHGHKVEYPCWAQPKLDGMRCIANSSKKISRKNTEITTLEHVKLGEIEQFIDGEMYAHGKTFQENMKLIKKYRAGETEDIKFHVYDMISDEPFAKRYWNLSNLIKGMENVQIVPTYQITNKKELAQIHARFLDQGYEGTMVRWGDDGYKVNGRSDNLLKYKDFKDVALPIVDVVESDRVPGQGIVIIEYNGHRSKTGSKLSHEERANLLTNRDKLIGQTAEIRYFEETDKGALRFPVFYGVRIDK